MLAAAALAACGGGSTTQPELIVATPSITFSVTAASGAAIVGGHVDIKCAAGTAGNAGTTTLADGSYTVTIAGAALPCVMRVTSGSTELYSLAEGGSGTAVRANITPFSHMVAAKTVGGDLAAFYQTFTPTEQAKLDSSSVASAITAVIAALSGTAHFAGMNPITGSFVIGDAFDLQLDAFKVALERAQVSLADVTAGVVTSGTAPVQTLLQPASTSCAGLRSGKYRVINPHEVGHDAAYVAQLITVNAATLTVTDDLDASHTPLAIAGHCRERTGRHLELRRLCARQQHAALCTRPGQDHDRRHGRIHRRHRMHRPGHLHRRHATLGSMVANPAGGVNHDNQGRPERAFVFETASGAMSLFLIDTVDGSFVVGTRQAALSLPVVGNETRFWDIQVGSNGVASAVAHSVVTVTAVDAAAQSFTRVRSSDGRVDGFTLNQPRDGLRYRAAGSSATTSGGSVNFAATIVMPLPGTGLVVNVSTAANQNFFGVSVIKP